ncbi:DNA-3-methyladenine glycosylase 2 family protein [Bacillus sp. HMF5848]|uniref:DNA-3-methyladenine glycosylase family protein n=1 Tax=Bacillus sp. HMF5848 TaxID=2495421 RepID=UPI000F776F26|nr:DNA-3-methyladenine glycosylase [Bacillus sp. HMF5848]RSK26075.1 DNA-3-methyladenine glycosylase 2 family protein [Bacillus sp. HMF5848]
MWEQRIDIQGPYDFDRVLSRLALDPVHKVDMRQRTVEVPIYKVGVVGKVQAKGTTDQPSFILQADGHEKLVMQELSRIFQWQTRLSDIDQHFSNTTLASIFAEHKGTPIVLDFSPYSCLLKCIIHQQLNLAFAFTLTQRFVEKFGHTKDGVYFYPSPQEVSNLAYDQLRELQFSMRKAEYVIDTSRKIAEGELNLEALEKLNDAVVIREITKIRGIGPWTAQNFLMFGLGRANLFPTADIGIQNALKKHFGLNDKPTIAQMEEWSQPWHPYLSYASLYLWRSIEPQHGQRQHGDGSFAS